MTNRDADAPILLAGLVGMVLGALLALGAAWLLVVLLLSFEGLAP